MSALRSRSGTIDCAERQPQRLGAEPGASAGVFADSHLSNTDWDLWVPASDEQTPSYAGKGGSTS